MTPDTAEDADTPAAETADGLEAPELDDEMRELVILPCFIEHKPLEFVGMDFSGRAARVLPEV